MGECHLSHTMDQDDFLGEGLQQGHAGPHPACVELYPTLNTPASPLSLDVSVAHS